MPSAQQLAGLNKLEVDMSLGCPPPGRDACELHWAAADVKMAPGC